MNLVTFLPNRLWQIVTRCIEKLANNISCAVYFLILANLNSWTNLHQIPLHLSHPGVLVADLNVTLEYQSYLLLVPLCCYSLVDVLAVNDYVSSGIRSRIQNLIESTVSIGIQIQLFHSIPFRSQRQFPPTTSCNWSNHQREGDDSTLFNRTEMTVTFLGNQDVNSTRLLIK